MNCKRTIALWLLLITGTVTALSYNYHKAFGNNWNLAVQCVNANHAEWSKTLREMGITDVRLAEAIVFPELIRYSRWRNEIEKTAVTGLYVTGCKEKGNYSIGLFQMRPSFAEDVEREWNTSPLAQEFGFFFDVSDNISARRSRVMRLSTNEGQCRYLAMFLRLQLLRHPQLLKMSRKERLCYLATAYNRSHTASWSSIVRMQKQRTFHTDIIRAKSTQLFRYCEISTEFLREYPR